MVWWSTITDYLHRSKLVADENAPKEPKNLSDALKHVFFTHAIDWLYWLLSVFTQFYFWIIAGLFFSGRGGYYFISTELLGALSEPYLGALGIYVIIKEIRKRKIARESRHFGEVYVILWLILLMVSSFIVLFTEHFHIDAIMKLIITNSMASLVIYIAGKIHRP